MDDMIHQVTHGGGPEPGNLLYKQAVSTVDRAIIVAVVNMFYMYLKCGVVTY